MPEEPNSVRFGRVGVAVVDFGVFGGKVEGAGLVVVMRLTM